MTRRRPQQPTSSRLGTLAIVAVGVVLAGCVVWWSTRPPKPDAKSPPPVTTTAHPDAAVAAIPVDAAPPAPDPNPYVGSSNCRECHKKQYADLQKDWHTRALSPGDGSAVVGNFDDAHFQGASSEATMSHQGFHRTMRTAGVDGGLASFPVDYVVGGKRMQDAVTVFPDGRWQVLPVYFHVTAHEWVDYTEAKQGALTPEHPFYWTNVRRMANHECLDCHTTGLHESYDDGTRAWTTTYADAGVACEACHGPSGKHAESQVAADVVQPVKAGAIGVAACARCHGPRQPLWPLLDAEHAFRVGDDYDEFYDPVVVQLPSAGTSDDFFPDGRPKTSSFEYQAMLQSACYRKGNATCLTCHDAPHATSKNGGVKHANELRDDPDKLCRGCHKKLDPKHTHHQTKAATCVACHMPPIVSGVLDAFADHAIDVPNPDNKHGVPDACAGCHKDKKPADLQAKLVAWWPKATARQARRARLADAFDEKTAAESRTALEAVVADKDEAPTVRGAAAVILGRRFGPTTKAAVAALVSEAGTVLRAKGCEALGAAKAAGDEAAAHVDRGEKSLRVRLACALALLDSRDPRGEAALTALASDPQTTGLMLPHTETAQLLMRRGDLDAARDQLAAAVQLSPYFVDALMQLAGLEKRLHHDGEAKKRLDQVLTMDPHNKNALKARASLK